MKLSGPQAKRLLQAVLAGFNGSDLEQLVRFDLNARLDNLVGSGSLPAVIFQLIEWAEAQGRTEELIRAVASARPNNQDIQAVAKELLSPPAATASATGSAELDGPRRSRLRAALVDQFPTRTALAMLVDDALSVNLETVARGTNLTETVFELIQWASINPQKQLRPLLAEAIRQRPDSNELKALKNELFGG